MLITIVFLGNRGNYGDGAPRSGERLTQEKLDLSIERAQVVRGPPLEGGVQARVEPDEE